MILQDYQVRFLDEYTQLHTRYEKLNAIISLAEQDSLNFELSCPLCVLKRQRKAMSDYLSALDERAEIEELKGELEKWL